MRPFPSFRAPWALLCGALLALGAAPAGHAVVRRVSDAAGFNGLPALNAGDVVVLEDGAYGELNKTLVSTITSDAEALANPIRVHAATPGGAVVTQPSRITLQGRGIILAGLDFAAGSGMYANTNSDPVWIIKLDANSRHMTVSNVRFRDCVAGDDYGHWIYVEGFNHTIEYCHFSGKTTRNATVAFKRNTAEAGIATPRQHVLRYNYFGPRECSTSQNGYESIRIGDSSSQAHDMRVTVERNVFYRAIWRDDGQKPNDMEIISNKSRGNRILRNTLLESYGQITLRHGDACLVEGNFIFGGGAYAGDTIVLGSANSNQGGVRVIGQDHQVRNNYFVNLSGTNLRAALCVMAGATTWDDGDGSDGNNGYESAANATISHNTFINCREINLGYVDTGSLQPTGVRLFNNAWQGAGSSNGVVRNSAFTPAGSGGNYFYHPDADTGWNGLGGTYTASASPRIDEIVDHYRRPAAGSPLLDAAHATLVATEDIRGLARPATGQDIGCHEREAGEGGFRPLLRREVGPVFDGGPAGTYPDGSSPTPYQAFRTRHGLDATNGAPLADPDADGIVNAVEFLLGTDPTLFSAGDRPTLNHLAGENGGQWHLTFRAVAALGAVTWAVEHSGDLVNWDRAQDGVAGVSISSTPAGAEWNQIAVILPAAATPFFARLSVTVP